MELPVKGLDLVVPEAKEPAPDESLRPVAGPEMPRERPPRLLARLPPPELRRREARDRTPRLETLLDQRMLERVDLLRREDDTAAGTLHGAGHADTRASRR